MIHSPKFYIVKNHYDNGDWTKEQVRAVVKPIMGKPWITEWEYTEITGEPYE